MIIDNYKSETETEYEDQKTKKKTGTIKKKIVVGILNAVKHSIIDCYP